MPDFVAYIDEAGDEGFGKLNQPVGVGGQSRWLAIGACVVSGEDDKKLPQWRNEIIGKFPRRQSSDLHFRDLNHDQRVVACQEIAKLPLGAVVTLSNKTTIPGSQWAAVFKQKGYLYNYLVRWLLERLTDHCFVAAGRQPCTLKLVFSRRGGTDYHSMKEYLCLMRDGRELMRPVASINWRVLNVDDIVVEAHKRWAGLQIADCITSAIHNGVEPNIYGNYEPRYGHSLRGLLLDIGGRRLNRGIVPVPSLARSACDDAQTTFIRSLEEE